MTISLRKFLSLGTIDPSEPVNVKRWARFFDIIMLIIIFWLPIQWYEEIKGLIAPQADTILNWVVWCSFLIEAGVMTSMVRNKLYYLQTNWLNLFIIVTACPALWAAGSTYFALLRYLRIIILIRLILPQLYNLHRILSRNHFGATLIAFFTVTILSGILVAYIDPSMGSPWTGIWWAWQTVTTVGYGDTVPNTVLGKIFASFLMLIGVGLFSLVSANLAAYFIERGRRQKEKRPERQMQKQFRDLNERIADIEKSNQRVEDLLYRLLAAQDKESSSS